MAMVDYSKNPRYRYERTTAISKAICVNSLIFCGTAVGVAIAVRLIIFIMSL